MSYIHTKSFTLFIFLLLVLGSLYSTASQQEKKLSLSIQHQDKLQQVDQHLDKNWSWCVTSGASFLFSYLSSCFILSYNDAHPEDPLPGIYISSAASTITCGCLAYNGLMRRNLNQKKRLLLKQERITQ